eukprot:TRINITY_DN64979_c0_g1_i1.p1 TRINITY_DN64979_c0_g1~~TRINITY_DN64979_c0_g1_i1.p1  ORF type:complete len:171 (-),score=39.53 TRINITY_DN64979_c0_g1_i1:43-501(-)
MWIRGSSQQMGHHDLPRSASLEQKQRRSRELLRHREMELEEQFSLYQRQKQSERPPRGSSSRSPNSSPAAALDDPDQIFDAIDTNKDGIIDRDEWEHYQEQPVRHEGQGVPAHHQKRQDNPFWDRVDSKVNRWEEQRRADRSQERRLSLIHI